MPSRPRDAQLDAQIDRLYQLPLEEFTAARNALAKESGAAGAEIRALQKPPVAAWAINQVYWRGRPAFHALTAAAAALRAAHTAVVPGKRADLRAAGKAHEDALEAVLKSALALLATPGSPRPTRPGRPSPPRCARCPPRRILPAASRRLLQPTGFELMAGLSAGDTAASPARPAAPAPPEKAPKGATVSREQGRRARKGDGQGEGGGRRSGPRGTHGGPERPA